MGFREHKKQIWKDETAVTKLRLEPKTVCVVI